MAPSRRDFIRTAGVVGAGLTLSARRAGALPEPAGSRRPDSRPAPKSILILGGTGFIGPHTVRYAVERGHRVTILTRGRTQADVGDVEHLIGDRNDNLSALQGRKWDVVLDNNARDYRWVQLSTQTLKGSVGHYVFVSSISAYRTDAMSLATADRVLARPIIDEKSERFSPPANWKDGDVAPYGLTKALSENIAHAAFPGRTTVIRPGLIVGPEDPTDRYTYWPVRIDEGGEVLAPGNPDHSAQVIDQRDLTEWTVRLAENGTMGDFNATGPGARMSMAEMLYGIRAVTTKPVQFTWVPEKFLGEQKLAPWGDLPAWVPGDPLMFVSVEAAVAAGLTYRPLADTVRDTIAWDKQRPAAERAKRAAGMSRAREAEVLAAWHASRK